MNAYLDKNYGADADGNRATPMWFYELEPSDSETILDQLKDLLSEFDPIIEAMPEKVELQFINPITEDDVTIPVHTEQFLNELRVYKIVTKDNYQQFVNTLIKYDKSFALKLSLYLIGQLANQNK